MNDTLIEIRPSRGIARVGLRELWTYRDLIYFFVWRDVKVRYKQTFFGATWAIIQPLVLMVVFTFVFGRVLQVATPPGVPKPIFYYAALVPWTLFATSLTDASASLVTSAALVRKIYFPRLILPISAVGSSLLDFVVALSIVFVMIFAYGLGLSWRIVTAPPAYSHGTAYGAVIRSLGFCPQRQVPRCAVRGPVRCPSLALPDAGILFGQSTAPGYQSSLLPESDGGCCRGFPVGTDR